MLETTAGLIFDQWEQLESFQLIEAIGTSVVCSVQLRQRHSVQRCSLQRSSGILMAAGAAREPCSLVQ